MEEARSEEAKIHALTKFDEALGAYSANFESEEVALNFLLVQNDKEQLASFLTLIGNQRDFDKDRKPPWDHFELESTKLIFTSIFSYLEVPDLKSLRLVCKQFCEIVTPLMDAKTVLKYTDKKRQRSDDEAERFDLYLTEIIPLTPTLTWKTHHFRHVEISIAEVYRWITPNAMKTFESFFLSPCMFSVETLRVKGFRFDLFDIELETSIPACLARFWRKLKSIAFFDPMSYADSRVYLSQHPVRLTDEDQMSELEEIHFEVDCRLNMDWRFLEMCPNLKVIKIDNYHSDGYTIRPNAIAPMTRCLELILPRLRNKKIQGLHLKFGIRDETVFIAEFVTAVALKGSLEDVVYKISTLKQDCLSFIDTVPLPLKSAEFAISLETPEDSFEILKALHFKGYFHLDLFKFKCAQFAFEKQQQTLTLTENAEGAAGSLVNLVPIWFPTLQVEYIQPRQIQEEAETIPMEVDADNQESEPNSVTPLEASNEFCNAVDHFISNFGSTEEAVGQLLRMKETFWPNVTTFVYTCWASKLYDGEDWRMNPCVLEAICKRSSVASLKSMRLVCKRWSKLASIWLARSSVITSSVNKETDTVKRGRKRGLQISVPSGKSHPFLDPIRSWNIHLTNLEIQTCESFWDQRGFDELTQNLFMNPATANLESLRILKFSTNLLDQQILPYWIPKYLKKLKNLTLVNPISTTPLKFDQKPVESFMPLEKLVVQINRDWRPSWKFLKFCPNLKCFKLIGREFGADNMFYGFGRNKCANLIRCFKDVWPFLRDKSIRKLGLKFDSDGDIQPIADFVTKIASLGSLKDVSYEIDASAQLISDFLQSIPLPSRRAKLVLINGYDTIGYTREDPLEVTKFVTSALDQLAASGYMTKLERVDFGIRKDNRNRSHDLLVRDFSLIVTKSAVAFIGKNSSSSSNFSIQEDYTERLASWFPEMNYACVPWQIQKESRPEVRTRLLELVVSEGSAFHLPGISERSRAVVRDSLDPQEGGLFFRGETAAFDASIIHRYALAVPSSLRSQDLYSENRQIYVFSKVTLNEFEKVRESEEEGVYKKDISGWEIPENLAIMVRAITTKKHGH